MKPVKKLFFPFILICLLFACKKESFTSSPSAILTTTADTLHFDTVFTSVGSVSQVFKIINDNDRGIRINSVRLGGGSASPFRINIDGTPGPRVEGLSVGANDSLYVFVTVTINPTAANLDFVVRDSIEISYNGNTRWVQLDAYGRNAVFLRDAVVSGTETWNNDQPYVILGGLTVDTNAALSITKGTKIYLHGNAPFIVHGSLQVQGEKWDSTRVVFAGDRLDLPYRDYPGSYPGIIFSDVSHNNQISFALIKNAYQGIVVNGPSTGTKLVLSETIIDNAYDAGIIGLNTSLAARNLLVSNCGKGIVLALGGQYNFTHCTVAAFSNNFIQHREPALLVSNFLTQNGQPVANSLNAVFRNCIFWGEQNGLVESEVAVLRQGTTPFAVNFDQVLWRVPANPSNATVAGAINQSPPLFDSLNNGSRYYNFRLKENSPALNKGGATGLVIDLDGAPRPVGLPDLGAYERQ
ncbi:MAG TPA: choice-of-anchor Q domain-containing protein [Flavisolibacter sp.]|nr:choice-of-anchor Q domain-containing protein [Flavisolibacter sp.]